MTQTTDKERAEYEAWWRSEMNSEEMDLSRTKYPMTPPEKQMYKCHDTERAWLAWQAARRAPVVPQGWRFVPAEPTPEMYDRVMREGYYHDSEESVKAVLRSEYQDMLAAAPQPPEATVKRSLTVEAECTQPGSLMSEIRTSKPEAAKQRAVFINANIPDDELKRLAETSGELVALDAAPVVPQFSKVAKRKLNYLQEAGEEITGYAIQNKDGRRGAIDCHGFVYWWNEPAPVQMPEPAVPFAIFDCHGFYEARTTKAAAQSFCDHYNKRDADGRGCAPYTVQSLYTEHQVRQLLAQHGIK